MPIAVPTQNNENRIALIRIQAQTIFERSLAQGLWSDWQELYKLLVLFQSRMPPESTVPDSIAKPLDAVREQLKNVLWEQTSEGMPFGRNQRLGRVSPETTLSWQALTEARIELIPFASFQEYLTEKRRLLRKIDSELERILLEFHPLLTSASAGAVRRAIRQALEAIDGSRPGV